MIRDLIAVPGFYLFAQAFVLTCIVASAYGIYLYRLKHRHRQADGSWSMPLPAKDLAKQRTVMDFPNLPDIHTDKPDRSGQKLEVTLTNLQEFKVGVLRGIITSLGILLGFGYGLIENKGHLGFFMPFMAACIFLICAFFLIKRPLRLYKKFRNDATIIRAYENGIWFAQYDLFVPYERVLAVNAVWLNQNLYGRIISIDVLISPGDMQRLKLNFSGELKGMVVRNNTVTLRLSGRDGWLTPSHKEIITTLLTLAAKHNQAVHIPPPESSIAVLRA